MVRDGVVHDFICDFSNRVVVGLNSFGVEAKFVKIFYPNNNLCVILNVDGLGLNSVLYNYSSLYLFVWDNKLKVDVVCDVGAYDKFIGFILDVRSGKEFR